MLNLIKKYWLLIIIFALGTFLRFYKLPSLAMFQSDQARDSIVVADIFRRLDPVFIGPVTSVGNMYLGPFYYYLMLPWLLLSYPSPLGPIYFIAVLSSLTILFGYFVALRVSRSKTAALFTSLFLAFSQLLIFSATFSWNPNPAPFFMLLLLFLLWLIWDKNYRFGFPLAGLVFGLLIQLHYVYLLAGLAIGVVWVADLLRSKKSGQLGSFLLKKTTLFMAAFLLTLVPLALFDLKHDFLNSRALSAMFVGTASNFTSADTVNPNSLLSVARLVMLEIIVLPPTNNFPNLPLYTEGNFLAIASVFSIIVLILSALYLAFLRRQKSPLFPPLLLCWFVLVGSIFALRFYKNAIYPHYLLFLAPVVALFFALLFSSLWQIKPPLARFFSRLFIVVFLSVSVYLNLSVLSFSPPGTNIASNQRIAEFISSHVSPAEPYHLVLISYNNDHLDVPVRYFLSTTDHPPVDTAASYQAQKLFIIDDKHDAAAATSSALFDIVIIPDKTIREHYWPLGEGVGPEIYVLYNDNAN